MRLVFSLACMGLLLISSATTPLGASSDDRPVPVYSSEGLPQVDYGRVKVGFTEAIPADIDAQAREHGGVVALRSDVLKFVAIELDDGVDGDGVIAAFQEMDGVAWALYDGFAYLTSHVRRPLVPNPPNDPLWSSQYGPALIGATGAWAKEKGQHGLVASGLEDPVQGEALPPPGVIIAILDTGVDVSHEDLTIHCMPHCAQAPYDVYGHGTHVAGIAAASASNAKGIAGIAHADIMAVKALTDAGATWWTHVAVAIVDATAAGANIISMSIGGNCNFNGVLLCPELDAAVQLAWSLGVVIIAASGNNGSTTTISHPGAFNNVVTVGSVGSTKVRTWFSNGGAQLDLMAPGEFVLSSVPKESLMCGTVLTGYCAVSGTSMSTPHVAGVAALVWAHCPTLTNVQVVSILTSTAEDLGAAGWDSLYGFGLVRADSAINATPVC